MELVKYTKERDTALEVDDIRKDDEYYLREMAMMVESVKQARKIHGLTIDANEDNGDYEVDDAEDLIDRIFNRAPPYYEAITLFRRKEMDIKKIDDEKVTDIGHILQLVFATADEGSKEWDFAEIAQSDYLPPLCWAISSMLE